MAVYKARAYFHDTELLGDEDYTWNFHVASLTSSDDAWNKAAAQAANFLDTLCPATIELVKVNIENRDTVNGLQTRLVGTHGTRAVTGDPLPGWNVARFQASVNTGSRAHTWFLRCGLTEGDVDGQLLTATMLGVVDNFLTALEALGTFVDKDGAPFTVYSRTDRVYMRQLGWHRRTRPGFRRGWVPA